MAVKILGEVRERLGFAIFGYVIMPEHVHLLINEPKALPPARFVQVFQQRVARRLRSKKRARPFYEPGEGLLAIDSWDRCSERREEKERPTLCKNQRRKG